LCRNFYAENTYHKYFLPLSPLFGIIFYDRKYTENDRRWQEKSEMGGKLMLSSELRCDEVIAERDPAQPVETAVEGDSP
jgi:hypothetical protein